MATAVILNQGNMARWDALMSFQGYCRVLHNVMAVSLTYNDSQDKPRGLKRKSIAVFFLSSLQQKKITYYYSVGNGKKA